MTKPTAILVNPHANNGRAGRELDNIRRYGETYFPGCDVVVTERIEDLNPAIQKCLNSGIERFLSVGGDGTNNTFINALIPHIGDTAIEYGNIPMGSGKDFARMLGTPFELDACLKWLANREAKPIDLGLLRYGDTERLFVNTSSVGLSYYVNENVENASTYYPWTFTVATLRAAFAFQGYDVTLVVDGNAVYSNKIFLIVMSNGSTFGGGMKIAPDAVLDDELLEIITVDYAPVPAVLSALATVRSGNHLNHPRINYFRGRDIEVRSNAALGCETDGEIQMSTGDVHVGIAPHRLNYLV